MNDNNTQKVDIEELKKIKLITPNCYKNISNYLIPLFNQTSVNILEKEVDKYLNNFSLTVINYYFESIAYIFACKQDTFIAKKLNNKCLYAIFTKYPKLMSQILYKRTIQEIYKIIEELKDYQFKYKEIINDKRFNYQLEMMDNYVNTYYKDSKINNILYVYNALYGIEFDNIYIPHEEIPENTFIVNIGYNLKDYNYIYHKIDNITHPFLTLEDVNNVTLPTKYEIVETNKPCEFIKSKLKIIEKELSVFNGYTIQNDEDIKEFNIGICYNNSKSLDKCLYSISKNKYTFKDILVLINGGIIEHFNIRTNLLYINEIFSKNREYVKDLDKLKWIYKIKTITIEELTKKIISCYNEDYKQTIYNIQNAFDDKYLKLYIQGLKYIQENGIITFEQYYEFIKPYFLFDL